MLIAGVDEVGRGPLAGDVVTAAVILDPEKPIDGLNDSKKLSEKKRQQLSELIKENALVWAIGRASVAEIDQLNILQATLLAMKRAVEELNIKPDKVLVDGNKLPDFDIPAEAIVGGDGTVAEISAASIIAKVTRDEEMIALEQLYPGYGFMRHKGYGTKVHMEALKRLGATPVHRKSFSPVAAVLEQSELDGGALNRIELKI